MVTDTNCTPESTIVSPDIEYEVRSRDANGALITNHDIIASDETNVFRFLIVAIGEIKICDWIYINFKSKIVDSDDPAKWELIETSLTIKVTNKNPTFITEYSVSPGQSF